MYVSTHSPMDVCLVAYEMESITAFSIRRQPLVWPTLTAAVQSKLINILSHQLNYIHSVLWASMAILLLKSWKGPVHSLLIMLELQQHKVYGAWGEVGITQHSQHYDFIRILKICSNPFSFHWIEWRMTQTTAFILFTTQPEDIKFKSIQFIQFIRA